MANLIRRSGKPVLIFLASLLGLSYQTAQASFFNPFMPNHVTHAGTNTPTSQTTNTTTIGRQEVDLPANFSEGRPTLQCIIEIAEKRKVPVDLMLGIQSVERGETGQQVKNTNASYDLGAFQINTIHLPRIQKLGGSKADVLQKGCYNAEIASLLLSEALNHPRKQHEDFFTRASGYHSWTPKHNTVYRQKLIRYTKDWQNWLRHNNMGHLIQAPKLY